MPAHLAPELSRQAVIEEVFENQRLQVRDRCLIAASSAACWVARLQVNACCLPCALLDYSAVHATQVWLVLRWHAPDP